MRLVVVCPNEVRLGDKVTVWRAPSGHSGLGGEVVALDDNTIRLSSGAPDRYETSFDWEFVHHITVEQPLDASECLNFGPDCAGPVDHHTTGTSMRAWPRCDFHQDQRQASHDRSLERYADSDVVPDWFDPADAGESWFDA